MQLHKRFVHADHGVARGQAQAQLRIPPHGVGHDARGFAAYFLSIRFQSEQHSPPSKELRIADEQTAPVVTAYRKRRDRKSTRLNSSHLVISYAVFCLKKKQHQLGHSRRISALNSDIVPLYLT